METAKVTMATQILLYLRVALTTAVVTLLWIPAFLFRCAVIQYVKMWKPSYGKILGNLDTIMVENYSECIPSNTLVYTLILEGSLQLPQLQKLFTENVLKAKITSKKGEDKLRYPEFQQYQSDFMGYLFWRNEEPFEISDHITEEPYTEYYNSPERVHQDMNNRKYDRKRSPWDIVLVENYLNNPNKTLLVIRVHHGLADTKACIKFIVECLGQKYVKEPTVQFHNISLLDKIKYYALMPFNFIHVQVFIKKVALRSLECHWIPTWKEDKGSPLNTAISEKISLSEIKQIAKRNGVTTSAVVMAAVAGGIAKSDKRHTKDAMPMQWILPKVGHPEILTNHFYLGIADLPTDVDSARGRLLKCNEVVLQQKTTTIHRYRETLIFQDGTWFRSLRFKLSIPAYYPLMVTNIASDGEGFSVGSIPCSEFTMSSGAGRSIICLFSYKDTMEVTATFRNSMLSGSETRKLTRLIRDEFDVLKSL